MTLLRTYYSWLWHEGLRPWERIWWGGRHEHALSHYRYMREVWFCGICRARVYECEPGEWARLVRSGAR